MFVVPPEASTLAQGPEGRPSVVLQVLPAMVSGGVERGTVDMARAIRLAGGVPIIASAGGPMAAEAERRGARHVTLPLDSKSPLALWRNVGRLAAVIERHRVDLVHARSRAPAWSAWQAARRTGRPFVTTVHNVYGEGGGPIKRSYNAIMGHGDRVIAISDFVAEAAIVRYHAGAALVRVIPRGIDLDAFDPWAVSPERLAALAQAWRLPDGMPVVMMPGRLTRWKGQEVLIDALARLGRHDLRCLIIGSDHGHGGFHAALERRISRLGLEDVVHLVTECPDMPAAYMLADVVVSASTRPEGFGRVAVEGQAMGRPVIATDHGGARETVLPGETGWLVPPGDAGAIAAALAEAIALDGAEREALAARAREHVERHFSRDVMCGRTIAVYNELLGSLARP